ncbi:MAG: hypothetical protein RL223_2508 [Pseudomonadota bacterium]
MTLPPTASPACAIRGPATALRFGLPAVVLALLSACGGGGGGSGSAGSDEIYDLDTAITQAYAKGFQARELQATSNGVAYKMDFELRPIDDVVIDDRNHKAVRHLSVITSTSSSAVQGSEEFYTTTPFRTSVTIGTNSYQTHTVLSNLPAQATPGATVTPLSQALVYASRSAAQSGATALGVANQFWRLDRVTATTAQLCLITTYSEPATLPNTIKSSNEECLTFDRSKALEVVDARVTINGVRFQ